MAGDLETDRAQVHDQARRVRDFWFALSLEQQFAKDEALDREIGARFADLRAEAVATQAAGWRNDPDTLLAAIILVDQFSRNLFRGKAEAFVHDPLARELALFSLVRGWDEGYPPEQRAFAYLPFEHAEDAALQRLSVAKFAALGREEYIGYARDHAAAIERFGRFPSRNAALGRDSTPEEEAWLARGGGW